MNFARGAAALLFCLTVGACTFGEPPLTGQERANQQTVTACRQRAEEAYDIQHRGDIYRPPAQINTPYSGAYAPAGLNDRRLSALYARDQMISDCVRNTGTQTNRGRLPSIGNAP